MRGRRVVAVGAGFTGPLGSSPVEQGVSVTHLDSTGDPVFVRLRAALGVTSFGLNAILLDPGHRGRIHRHERQEEVYLVLEGRLTLTVEGEDRELGRYDAARVAPEVRRQLSNRGVERLVVLAMGGANEHVGRDGLAYTDWDDADPRPPDQVPLPPPLPVER
jgi:uncharacterized cupin superfamily protein